MMQPVICVVRQPLSVITVIVSIGSAGPAVAQQRPATLTFGAAMGAGSTGNSWSGGAGGQTAATHLDLPLNGNGRLRVEAGMVHWRPHNEPLGDIPVRAGHVWLSHIGVTALRYGQYPWTQGMYAGWGLARYRYFIQRGHVRYRTTWGLHGVAGYEHFTPGDRWGVHVEAGVQAVGGPGHSQVWASMLPMLSASVGMSRRF
jgi:hypothetical protein